MEGTEVAIDVEECEEEKVWDYVKVLLSSTLTCKYINYVHLISTC